MLIPYARASRFSLYLVFAVVFFTIGLFCRELSEQKTSPARSLSSEKQVTPPISPVKCSPVVAAVVSTPDPELR